MANLESVPATLFTRDDAITLWTFIIRTPDDPFQLLKTSLEAFYQTKDWTPPKHIIPLARSSDMMQIDQGRNPPAPRFQLNVKRGGNLDKKHDYLLKLGGDDDQGYLYATLDFYKPDICPICSDREELAYENVIGNCEECARPGELSRC